MGYLLCKFGRISIYHEKSCTQEFVKNLTIFGHLTLTFDLQYLIRHRTSFGVPIV